MRGYTFTRIEVDLHPRQDNLSYMISIAGGIPVNEAVSRCNMVHTPLEQFIMSNPNILTCARVTMDGEILSLITSGSNSAAGFAAAAVAAENMASMLALLPVSG